MANARYNQLVEEIESCETEEDLDRVRAAVSAYRMQRGGIGIELLEKVKNLTRLINNKLNEINKEFQ